MSKSESMIIGLFLGITCPFLTFVAFWWSTAAFHLCVFPLPSGVIATAALAGLGLGCLLDVFFLGFWVKNFYRANLWWMFVLYLGCFVVGFASFMGLPVGTVAAGLMAGVYVGRRENHSRVRNHPTVALRRTAILTSLMTTAASLPIGILGLKEPIVSKWLEAVSGFDQSQLHGTAGFIMVGLFCPLLFAMQYVCTEIAGRLAFRISSGGVNHDP